MEDLEDNYAIGLDLGTTFSCIGVYRNGGVEIIPNSNGERTTPSIVIFLENKVLVGEDTTNFLVQNYDTCIYEIKRLIGRKYSDKKLQEEIKKLPFTIIHANNDSPEVEIKINGTKKKYSPKQISALIIKKMVANAEKYLNRTITELVITVPAYFNDNQTKLTKEAAESIGLKVLRIIKEPTAAALAYGFDKTQNINGNKNGKILIFDLGGGTFDVSILSLSEDKNNKNYKTIEVLGTYGDTMLGGEDFDNQLVEHFLKKLNFDEVKNNNKIRKKLKIACENIKKILSTSEQTILRINNFYNNQDISEKITRKEFEDICNNLFMRLEEVLDSALKSANISKEEIDEIILVGGSTRIPKVKEIVKNYFGKDPNDNINADEVVAFGATINAEKILHNKDDSISNFNLLDVTPLSLGTNIINKSIEPNIQKEGEIMSVIIKRGTIIPTTNSKTYYTAEDNQTGMSINIYEGEKLFVNKNHLLRKYNIEGLTKRKKGKTKVIVTFDIDINGILTVKGKEESENNDGKSFELVIKNDDISLTKNELKKLENENKILFEQMNDEEEKNKNKNNIKFTLKKYKDAYEKFKNKKGNEKKLIAYKTNFNNTLEKFIDKFNKDFEKFDNETVLEKFYLYIKELFLSYIESLQLELSDGAKNHILEKIKEYIKLFINKSTGYLNSLLDILARLTEIDMEIEFYKIVIFVIEELNNNGKECVVSNKKFCKYHSLMYFEQAQNYFEKYLPKTDEDQALLSSDDLNSIEEQKKIFSDYIKNINSGAIILCLKSFKVGELYNADDIESSGTGFTGDIKKFGINKIHNTIENLKIILENYEKLLTSIQNDNKFMRDEAICIASIIKLNILLGYLESKKRTLLTYVKRCNSLIKKLTINENEKWYKEYKKIYEENFKDKDIKDEEYQDILNRTKKKNKKIFDEIDKKFNKGKGKDEFIDYILKNHPYKNYKNDVKKPYNLETILSLIKEYQPDNYSSVSNLKSDLDELNYCIMQEISKRLTLLYETVDT